MNQLIENDATQYSHRFGKQIATPKLSERQQQCLKLLLSGKTSKMTAQVLGISFRTVEHHIERIKDLFNVQYKTELIEKAFKMGFRPYL